MNRNGKWYNEQLFRNTPSTKLEFCIYLKYHSEKKLTLGIMYYFMVSISLKPKHGELKWYALSFKCAEMTSIVCKYMM